MTVCPFCHVQVTTFCLYRLAKAVDGLELMGGPPNTPSNMGKATTAATTGQRANTTAAAGTGAAAGAAVGKAAPAGAAGGGVLGGGGSWDLPQSQELWWRVQDQREQEEEEEAEAEQTDVTKPWGTRLLVREGSSNSSGSGCGGGGYRSSGGFLVAGLAGEQMSTVIEQLAQYGAFLRLMKVRDLGFGTGRNTGVHARG